jgi:hypothetical protein
MVRVAGVRPDLIPAGSDELKDLANDPNATVRGYTALLAGELTFQGKEGILSKLAKDSSGLRIYSGGALIETTVAELAREAIK